MKISGLVVFKNEGKWFLKESVQSFLQLCDEVIAVDSGCTDEGESVRVLESLNDNRVKIVRKTQKSENNKEYGDIKNWAMQFCSGDYVFSFDADEVLDDTFYLIREQLLERPEVECWSVQGRHYYWHLTREDAQLPAHWWANRLFKNNTEVKYPSGKAHGLPSGFRVHENLKGLFIHHYGYCKNACVDLWRYDMNANAPEIHSSDYLSTWLGLRLTGQFPTKNVDLIVHPQCIKDKFHMERWVK